MSSTALVPVSDLERMAQAIAGSKLFGIQNQEQALALMLVAQAEGLHPATAARDYHIIQGRPALKADAMLARYLNTGGSVEWHEHTDEKVCATFTHPQGGKLKIDWDMARAKKAGLGAKPTWAQYPRQMLRARVISEGVRATNPAVAIGVYTVEETQDFDAPKRTRKEKDMGAAEVINEIPLNPGEVPLQANGDFISTDQHIVLMDELKGIPDGKNRLKKAAKVERLTMIKTRDYARALAWVENAKNISKS